MIFQGDAEQVQPRAREEVQRQHQVHQADTEEGEEENRVPGSNTR